MAFPRMMWLITATPFFRCRLPTAYQRTVPHIPILPLKATTFLWWFSLGFVTADSVLLTSSIVFCLRSASVVFVVVTPLRQTEHYFPISLLFHSSPSPVTGSPGDSNNTPPRRAAPFSLGLLNKPHTRCVLLVRVLGESFH